MGGLDDSDTLSMLELIFEYISHYEVMYNFYEGVLCKYVM